MTAQRPTFQRQAPPARRMAALAVGVLMLASVGISPLALAQPSTDMPASSAWPTGQQLVDALTQDHGYTFGTSQDYPDDTWFGPTPTTEEDTAYGGTGTIVVRSPLDVPAMVIVKTGLQTATSPEGCRYVWRILDELVPNATDQQDVWAMLGDAIDAAAHRTDPAYSQTLDHTPVQGGAVHLEFILVAGDEQGGRIEDPSDYYGGIAFEFRPSGAAPELTPSPDRPPATLLTRPASPMPDLAPCTRPPAVASWYACSGAPWRPVHPAARGPRSRSPGACSNATSRRLPRTGATRST